MATKERAKAGTRRKKTAPQLHVEALKKFRIVIRAAQRHSSWIERQCGVTGAQLWLLRELQETPGLRVGQLAELMVMHQTTVSNLLDALEKQGLVIKRRDEEDLRVVNLALTAKGADVLSRAPTPARGILPESLRRMDVDQLTRLNEGLAALIETIDAGEDIYGLQPLPFTV